VSVRARAAYFARAAAQDLRHAPFTHFISVATLAVALLGLGVVRSAMGLGSAAIQSLRSEVQLTAYLRPGVTPVEAEQARTQLARAGGAPVKLVTPSEALARLSRDLGPSSETLTNLPENPLPFSLELRVPEGGQSPEALAALAARVRAFPQVEAVDYGEAAVARLSRLSAALRLAGTALLTLLVLATIVTVAATFQLSIYARRTEVEIQKLVGATNTFVRAPFLLEGAVQGAVAAAVALILLALGLRSVQAPLEALLGFLGLDSSVAPRLSFARALELIGVGLGLGLFGSGVAVRRFLRT
jgi:cell division transport system permease protein